MLEKIILIFVFALATLVFYFARKIAKDRDRVVLILKIVAAVIMIACVVYTVYGLE